MGQKNRLKVFLVNRKFLSQVISLLIVFLLFWLMQNPGGRVVTAPIFKGPGGGMVALTVNVDWGEDCIPRMLKILADNGAEATFFLTGKWAEKFPNLTRAIAEKGHEIGNHGYQHLHPKNLDDRTLQELILKNESLLQEICGVKTTIFAPPYGEFDNRIVSASEEIGYRVIMWSIDTIDWQRPAYTVLVDRVKRKLEDGAIILLHPTEPTLQALPEIIRLIKANNLKPTTVSELLEGGSKDDNED